MKTYLVTGSSGDIGIEIVKQILKDKNNKVIGIDIADQKIVNKNYKHLKIDLSDLSEIEKFNLDEYKISSIIHAAGVYNSKKLEEYNLELIEKTINVNILSLVIIIKNIVRRDDLLENMIIISSTAGKLGSKDPIYSLSKAALEGLMKSLGKTEKCRINIISPGIIDTQMSRNNQSGERINYHIQNTIAKRIGKIEDVVNTVLFLLSRDSNYIWGQNIYVNGGMS